MKVGRPQVAWSPTAPLGREDVRLNCSRLNPAPRLVSLDVWRDPFSMVTSVAECPGCALLR